MSNIEIQRIMVCSICHKKSLHTFVFDGDFGPYDRDTYKAVWISKCCKALHLVSGGQPIEKRKEFEENENYA